MAQPIRFPASVEQVRRHTPDVMSLRLRSQKRLPRFTPGQFVHLTMDAFDPASFWPESRVFSVANAVGDRRTIDLTISRQGAYTARIIDELQEGDEVWAKGPYGDFTVDAAHGCSQAVLVAGGTGVTPFCAFMDAALTAQALPLAAVELHYGARTPELLLYRELATRCATHVPGFSVHLYAEHDVGGDAAQGVTAGRIDIARIVAAQQQPDDTAFYLSGPKPMIDALRFALVEQHGIAPERVLVDAWE